MARSKSAIVKRSPRVDPRRARVRQHERARRRRRSPRTTRTRDTARGSGSPPPPHVPRPPEPPTEAGFRKTDSATRFFRDSRVERSSMTSVFVAKRRNVRGDDARRRDELHRHTSCFVMASKRYSSHILSPPSSTAGLARRLFTSGALRASRAVAAAVDDGAVAAAAQRETASAASASVAAAAGRGARPPSRRRVARRHPDTCLAAVRTRNLFWRVAPALARAPAREVSDVGDVSLRAQRGATTRGHARSRKCSCPFHPAARASRIRNAGSRRHCLQLSLGRHAPPLQRVHELAHAPLRLPLRARAQRGLAASRARRSSIGRDTAPESSAAANAPQPPAS